jgi:aspartyl-tRNA(Asn)/glutamyl-tRNA(Gln) amidotransferase subunit A
MVVGVLDQAMLTSTSEPGSGTALKVTDMGQVVSALENLGAIVVPTQLPAPATDLVPIMLHEASVEHRETFPSQRDRYGPDTQVKWDAAAEVTYLQYADARRELPRWRERVRFAGRDIDVYLSPTLAHPIPELTVWEPDVRIAMVANTRAFSFLGWPAVAIGDVQLSGPDTNTVLSAALAWEEAGNPITVGTPA